MARSRRTASVPVMSKELADITFSGEWGTTDDDPKCYEKAITPFTMITPDSDLGKLIIKRNEEYDCMASHKTAPTAAEARAFQTNEVHLIRSLEDLDRALTMLKVYLLVFGETRHAKVFKEFYNTKWNYLFRLLYHPKKLIPRTVTEPYLPLACYISNMMSHYFRDLLGGEDPPSSTITVWRPSSSRSAGR